MHQLGILGCGWLGVPLGNSLKKLNFNVKGTRRSEAGISALNKNGIEGYQVFLDENESESILFFLKLVETLIISIPPDKKSKEKEFVQRISFLLNCIELSNVKRIIFLSSTSVYGSKGGNFNELNEVNPKNPVAKALHTSEKLIMNSTKASIIVRLGGLIGKDRNPIFKLQNRYIGNPGGRINFIHQQDAVSGICNLIVNPQLRGIYNLVSPHHPNRKKYYEFMAKKLGLPSPKFSSEPAIIRIIQARKIEDDTPFKYTVNNLLI